MKSYELKVKIDKNDNISIQKQNNGLNVDELYKVIENISLDIGFDNLLLKLFKTDAENMNAYDMIANRVAHRLHNYIIHDKLPDYIDKSNPIRLNISNLDFRDSRFEKNIIIENRNELCLILIKYTGACSSIVYYNSNLPIIFNGLTLYPFDFSPSAVAFEVNKNIPKDSLISLELMGNSTATILLYFKK